MPSSSEKCPLLFNMIILGFNFASNIAAFSFRGTYWSLSEKIATNESAFGLTALNSIGLLSQGSAIFCSSSLVKFLSLSHGATRITFLTFSPFSKFSKNLKIVWQPIL